MNDDLPALVQRLRELAEYKYQSHTIHVPAALNAVADAIESLLARAESAEAECARLRNELRVAQVTLRDRAHPGDKDTRDPPDVLATLGFWPRCGCGECYAIHCLAEARAECARLRQWLDNNTTFYDTERIEDRTVLSAVSDRIWFHATDNTKDWPFSAVIDRAVAEGKHEAD